MLEDRGRPTYEISAYNAKKVGLDAVGAEPAQSGNPHDQHKLPKPRQRNDFVPKHLLGSHLEPSHKLEDSKMTGCCIGLVTPFSR